VVRPIPQQDEMASRTSPQPLLCHTYLLPTTVSTPSPVPSPTSFRCILLFSPHGPHLTTTLAGVQGGPPIAVWHPDLLQGVLGQFPWGRHPQAGMSRTAPLLTKLPGHLGPPEVPPLGPRPSSSRNNTCPSSCRSAPERLGSTPERLGSTPTEEGLASDYACPTRLPPLFGPSAPRPSSQKRECACSTLPALKARIYVGPPRMC
jgi:hypothetical protein